ncbi:MAG TPA: tRNA pseudouridine(55) synthase TruB [Cyclobacteriaceae bacterium]|nr:tRNA pseudouridine(55) synthase TruB [Cyclobacteriaceae bacterium]
MENDAVNQDRVLLINKPIGWTSFDAVKKLRGKLKIKKIGHAGTLDPLAKGLLIICTGKMTKQIDNYQGMEKEYTGTLVLGEIRPSHDMETEVIETRDISHITQEQIISAAAKLTGDIMQTPPLHSAIKIEGKRAYAFARKGKEKKLEPRPVQVSVFEITNVNLPEVDFRIVCSKGTYIRSLVRDMGELLGVGAYMSALCRTRIGDYHLKDAQEIESVA